MFAAGGGTRLRPLTDEVPKALVPVLDVPLVDCALAKGRSLGGRSFVNISHHARALTEHLERRPGVEVLDEGDEPYGTAATLRALLPRLSGTVVTYNCDLLSDLDLTRLLAAHRGNRAAATVAVQRVEGVPDLVAGAGGLRLVDRRTTAAVGGFRFLGAACFDHSALETIPAQRPLGLTAGLLERLTAEGRTALYEHRGWAADVGTIPSYIDGCVHAIEHPEVLGVTPPGRIVGQSYRGPGSALDGATLEPGAVVQRAARVGRDARIGRAVVWPGSFVPPATELSGAVWFRGAPIR